MNVLITGTTSGLGHSLAAKYLQLNADVYSLSRRYPDGLPKTVRHTSCDLCDLESVQAAMNTLSNIKFDFVYLNAGMLGSLAKTDELWFSEFGDIFNVNVWSNKLIIDNLLKRNQASHIISISSGAALKSYYGWSLYCSSKAALKQLISCYAQENPRVRFVSLAPGIIKTKMQDSIKEVKAERIPSVKKFHDLYDTMQTPDECADKILNNLFDIFERAEDSYFDLRSL